MSKLRGKNIIVATHLRKSFSSGECILEDISFRRQSKMTTKSIKYALTIVAREVMRKELEPCVVPVKDEFLAGVLEAGDDVGAFGFGGEEVENDVGESRH